MVLLALAACADRPTEVHASTSPAAATTPAPPVSAPTPAASDQDGAPVNLADLYQKGPVLVYFYPKADTPGCTAQACSLRDAYQKLTDAGLTVIGVSKDSAAQQKAFRDKYNLPFILIPDPEGVVLQAFGVSSLAGMASREAFLIRDGQIVWHDDSASTSQQADDVLRQLATWSNPVRSTP